MENNVSNSVASNNNGGVPNNGNNQQMNYKKFYIWMGVIVGLVLVVAGILLVFLLNGSIKNRNRLTCTKVTQEDGYVYSIKRYYTFDKKIMQRVYYTYTFTYDEEFTDDMYNQTFDEIINNETNGSTKYGLATNISKEGNVVTITSYEPNYWNENLDVIKDTNLTEGYTCQ